VGVDWSFFHAIQSAKNQTKRVLEKSEGTREREKREKESWKGKNDWGTRSSSAQNAMKLIKKKKRQVGGTKSLGEDKRGK